MLYRIGPLPLCLSASARTWQQPTTVSFWNSAIMSGKNKKNNSSDTQCYVQRKWFLLFLPRMMFSVAKQGVMMAGYVAVSLLTGTKPWQQHESSKSENISRGVLKVIVNIRNLNHIIYSWKITASSRGSSTNLAGHLWPFVFKVKRSAGPECYPDISKMGLWFDATPFFVL